MKKLTKSIIYNSFFIFLFFHIPFLGYSNNQELNQEFIEKGYGKITEINDMGGVFYALQIMDEKGNSFISYPIKSEEMNIKIGQIVDIVGSKDKPDQIFFLLCSFGVPVTLTTCLLIGIVLTTTALS